MGLNVLHERFSAVPRIALTATADEPTRREIIARLRLKDARVFISSSDRPEHPLPHPPFERRQQRRREQLLRFIREEHAK